MPVKRLRSAIDRFNLWLGRLSVWLLLASVFVSAGNAILRKSFAIGSNAMLELQWYLVGTMVMLAAAWVFQEDGHVRIEILAGRFSERTRRRIELAGHLLMFLPFAALMLWLSWPFFARSYAQDEISLNAGGLLVWPMRGIIVVGFAALTAQALSAILRSLDGAGDSEPRMS